MKKALLFIFVIIGFCAQAQDPEIFKTRFDSIGAIEFAKSIVNDTKDKFLPYYVSHNPSGGLNIVYKLETASDKEVDDEIQMHGYDCNNCFMVIFEKSYDKHIADLEIAENPHLRFKRTNNTDFLNLYPTWQKYFYPKPTAEEVLNKYSLRIYNTNGVFASFSGDWNHREGKNKWRIQM